MKELRPAVNDRRNARSRAEMNADLEIKGEANYWDYGSHIEAYENALGGLLGETISSWVKRRRYLGNTVYGMDIMSEGQALRDLPLTGGTSVTLVDLRDEYEKSSDSARNINLIAGDINKNKTWKNIKADLERKDASGFDIIIARPNRGLLDASRNPNVNYFLAQKVWSLLNPEGIFLGQIPLNIKGLEEWVLLLDKTEGIKASVDLAYFKKALEKFSSLGNIAYGPLLIEKGNAAPSKLPVLFA